MRLPDHPQRAAHIARPGGLNGSADLGWVVGVIINHRHPAGLAAQLETPACAAVSAERLAGLGQRQAKAVSHSQGSQGVAHIMLARNLQGHSRAQIKAVKPAAIRQSAAGVEGVRAMLVVGQVLSLVIGRLACGRGLRLSGLAVQTIGQRHLAAQAGLGRQAGRAGVIRAGQQAAARLQTGREGHKGLVEVLSRWEAVRVVVLHIGHHGQLGVQAQEHAVVFIGLDHKGLAAPGVRIGAQVGRDAADNV